MLCHRAMLVAYRMAPMTHFLAKRLVKTEWISLPNLIARETLVPELIQDAASADAIAARLAEFLDDDEARALWRNALPPCTRSSVGVPAGVPAMPSRHWWKDGRCRPRWRRKGRCGRRPVHECQDIATSGHRLPRERLAGVDEVGRGPLVGSVVAAAVILDPADAIIGLTDSKKLTARRREALDAEIRERAMAWSVAEPRPRKSTR